jgi:predicted nuclease of restriction endonuclease-like RecB superfamily
MLKKDMLRVRVRGKTIEPGYLRPDDHRTLELADRVLQVVQQGAAERWTQGAVMEALKEAEGADTRHKLMRGMAKLLLDKCDFEMDCPVAPAELRQAIFAAAVEAGPLARRPGPHGRPTARDVLEQVATTLAAPEELPGGWTADKLEDALYADHPEEQRLVARTGPDTPEALVHAYNLGLVQALLLRATHLKVRLARPPARALRDLFRRMKFQQLMVRVARSGADLLLEIDGPQSLLKQSTRYGLALAVFFPALPLLPGGWTVEAEVLWGNKRKLKKQLTVHHTRGLQSHYRPQGTWQSQAEGWFTERWEALETGWALSPGELIDLGQQHLLLPDLTLRKNGRVAHLDIVGFWRKGYLEKRLANTPDNVILAVSKRLVGDKTALPKTLAERVVPFAEIISAKTVLERVEAVARPEA